MFLFTFGLTSKHVKYLVLYQNTLNVFFYIWSYVRTRWFFLINLALRQNTWNVSFWPYIKTSIMFLSTSSLTSKHVKCFFVHLALYQNTFKFLPGPISNPLNSSFYIWPYVKTREIFLSTSGLTSSTVNVSISGLISKHVKCFYIWSYIKIR